VDFFEQRANGSLVVEVPNSMLGKSVYFYATTAKAFYVWANVLCNLMK
jgi:hypothetical protein